MASRTVTLQIPALRSRHDVRAISAALQDLDGVIALQTDLTAKRILVHGDVTDQAVRQIVEAAGYGIIGDW
jgi:copper chaperone CopZ